VRWGEVFPGSIGLEVSHLSQHKDLDSWDDFLCTAVTLSAMSLSITNKSIGFNQCTPRAFPITKQQLAEQPTARLPTAKTN